jgi:hypothetical protein
MPKRSHVAGTLYLICTVEAPYRHALHYLGWTERPDVLDRLMEHFTGKGSPLVKAICQQLEIQTPQALRQLVVALWPGYDRCTERWMKNRGGKARICPVCRARAGIFPTYQPRRCTELRDASG